MSAQACVKLAYPKSQKINKGRVPSRHNLNKIDIINVDRRQVHLSVRYSGGFILAQLAKIKPRET